MNCHTIKVHPLYCRDLIVKLKPFGVVEKGGAVEGGLEEGLSGEWVLREERGPCAMLLGMKEQVARKLRQMRYQEKNLRYW